MAQVETISADKALVMMALIETIQEVVVNEEHNLIEGHLYAQVMDKLSIEEFNFVLGTLKEAGIIKVNNNVISCR